MQRCDPFLPERSSDEVGACLNPTYPGCSAVITDEDRCEQLAIVYRLNPTYPGCSAVIRVTQTPFRPFWKMS